MKLIFDLDGTLWETKESYIYAYHKVCDLYKHKKELSDTEIEAYLGIPLVKMIPMVFPWANDMNEIGVIALKYSIEYIINNPKTLSNDIYKLFEELNKNNEIYVISNCVKPFLDAFYQISNVSKFVKKSYTIEDGTKELHISKITDNYTSKALFIGDAESDYKAILNHKMVYFCYAAYGYMKCCNYDFSIKNLDDSLIVTAKLNDLERMIKNTEYEFISSNDSHVVLMKKKDSYVFGFMDLKNKDDLKVILEKLKAYNDMPLYGPMNANTWYGYRIAIDSFDWKLYPDCISEEWVYDAFIKSGYKIHQTYSSTLAKFNERLWKWGRRFEIPNEYKYIVVSGNDILKYASDVFKLGSSIFKNNDYFDSISINEFLDLYIKDLPLEYADLIIMYKDGIPLAMSFGYDDPLKRFYVSKTIGVALEARGTKVATYMSKIFFTLIHDKGYKEILYHFQNDRTGVSEGVYNNLEIKKKHYALMEYTHE